MAAAAEAAAEAEEAAASSAFQSAASPAFQSEACLIPEVLASGDGSPNLLRPPFLAPRRTWRGWRGWCGEKPM